MYKFGENILIMSTSKDCHVLVLTRAVKEKKNIFPLMKTKLLYVIISVVLELIFHI